MKNSHNYAVLFGECLRNLFRQEKCANLEQIDVAEIESNWFASINFGLGYLFRTKREEVISFYNKYWFYLGMDLDELIKIEEGSDRLSDEYTDGEDVIKKIHEAFSALCKNN